ncbi:MAG: peptidoglycan editing factor PgeF [Lachnospiraceae bacterium]|nr:peptidoglycan editing factor PgeF [Lachnospiraceae bacterium]
MPETVKSSIISYPHGFSSRTGGVSSGVYSSLNLGMNRGDDPECVKENYRIFLHSCGIDREEFVCGEQVHGSDVMTVTSEHARKPYGYDKLFVADGYVTAESGVPLVIFTADCLPLLMADEKAGVIAAVHSGWRGTVQDIEKNAVEAMLSLGAHTEDIKACIGPSIGRCCFEVGDDVIEGISGLLDGDASDLYDRKENGKYMLDLKGVLKRCLIRTGLKEENIEISQDCTMCLKDKYWSHRLTGAMRGSQASVIMKP